MRVTSAIFVLEFPANCVQETGTPSVHERLQAADQSMKKTFVSLYSGKAGISQVDASAWKKRRATTRSESYFAFSFEMRIECEKDEFLDPDASN